MKLAISSITNARQPLTSNTSALAKAKTTRNCLEALVRSRFSFPDDCEDEREIREARLRPLDATSNSCVAEQETQTKTFVNSQGERILAIKTGFGYKYLKIGYEDPLFSDSNSNADAEISSRSQSAQLAIGQYAQNLSIQ